MPSSSGKLASDKAPRDSGRLWEPLKHGNFALLWFGFAFSHLGDNIQFHTQAWIVTDLTKSGLMVGGVALAQALPRLFLGMFSGVLIDSIDRRHLLLASHLASLGQTSLFLTLIVTNRISYIYILILAAVLGMLDTLNLNARATVLPTLVSRPLLGRVIALQALGVNMVQILGPALAALAIYLVGIVGSLIANIVTFIVLLAILVTIQLPHANKQPNTTNFIRELREGFEFVCSRPMLLGGIVLAYLLAFFGVSAGRLLALFARTTLQADAKHYGMLAAAIGVGAILASLFITARTLPRDLPRNTIASAAAFSLLVVALALPHNYVSATLTLVMFGGAQTAFRSSVSNLIQLETPDNLRGRVIGMFMLDSSLWSIGAAFVGAITDQFALLHASGRTGGTATVNNLSNEQLAFGLKLTFGVMGSVCLLSTAYIFARFYRTPMIKQAALDQSNRDEAYVQTNRHL